MTDFFNSLGIDPQRLILVLIAMIVVLIILVIIILVKTNKVFKRYDFFMRGKDAESLEDIIVEIRSKMYSMQDQEMENRDRLKLLQFGTVNSFQKTGLVKYNAFDGMGGKSSFALAMLDQNNTGYVFNAMHSRTSCYLYVKEVKNGEPDSSLGNEEKEALEIAKKTKRS